MAIDDIPFCGGVMVEEDSEDVLENHTHMACADAKHDDGMYDERDSR